MSIEIFRSDRRSIDSDRWTIIRFALYRLSIISTNTNYKYTRFRFSFSLLVQEIIFQTRRRVNLRGSEYLHSTSHPFCSRLSSPSRIVSRVGRHRLFRSSSSLRSGVFAPITVHPRLHNKSSPLINFFQTNFNSTSIPVRLKIWDIYFQKLCRDHGNKLNKHFPLRVNRP